MVTWNISILVSVWSVFIGYWIAAMFVYKNPQPYKRDKRWTFIAGLASITTVIIAYHLFDYLVTSIELTFPYRYIINTLGVILLLSGLSFTVWARKTLAAFWAGSVAVRENQPIMRKGPYAVVRHPIYAGIITMLWGTFLVGELNVFLFLASLGTVLLYWKAKLEEIILLKYKNEEYRAYMIRERI